MIQHCIFNLRNYCTKCTKEVLFNLDCKIVAIFGGTGGIGSSIAEEILNTSKVKHLALTGRDITKGRDVVEKLNCTFGSNKSTFFKSDVEDAAQIRDTLNIITKTAGKIDVVINTAGVWDSTCWQRELNINMVGAMNVNLFAFKFLNSPGMMINVIGLSGVDPLPATPTLTAAYSGMVAFSRCIGHETFFKRTGIRIATLCVGPTITAFNKEADTLAMDESLKKPIGEYLQAAHWQRPFAVAKSAVILIKHAVSGSVWVVEDSKLYQVNEFPKWRQSAALEAQFL